MGSIEIGKGKISHIFSFVSSFAILDSKTTKQILDRCILGIFTSLLFSEVNRAPR